MAARLNACSSALPCADPMFEDEAGQGLRPPKGRTWAPRGARPVVRVRGVERGAIDLHEPILLREIGARAH